MTMHFLAGRFHDNFTYVVYYLLPFTLPSLVCCVLSFTIHFTIFGMWCIIFYHSFSVFVMLCIIFCHSLSCLWYVVCYLLPFTSLSSVCYVLSFAIHFPVFGLLCVIFCHSLPCLWFVMCYLLPPTFLFLFAFSARWIFVEV